MKLTIAVPSFNRPAQLENTVRALRSQLTSECQLLVLDNHSEIPAADYLPADVSIIRHSCNLGMMGNVMRCFELCSTEWLWIASDDDVVDPVAVATILANVQRHPDAVMLSFQSKSMFSPDRKSPIQTVGLTDFLEKIENWTHLSWITTEVFNMSFLRAQIRFGISFGYTIVSAVVMVLLALGKTGKVWLLPESIATHGMPGRDDTWSFRDFDLALGTLFDLPIGTYNRKLLASKVARQHLRLGRELINLAFDPFSLADSAQARYLFRAKWKRYVDASGEWGLWAKYRAACMLSYCAPLLRIGLPHIYRLAKKKELRIDKVAWFERL